ncbi:O-acetyl-ADP-ribose deacetylase [Parafrankia elaeagni]|uniref:O-acetyl-ADP-ribose deacetylase n=1 Tax=Parafrankia elaeagni TaxID=222534 RepID=UPI00036F4C80|nr:O-acetyl-ADP-ribose deacetylase [Parafrankia elaeagni]
MITVRLVQGDITDQEVDAVVNAANSSLLSGGGVDGAIHAAGGPEILAACRELRATTLPGGLPTGEAVATTAGRLRARHVIHVVGPVYTTGEGRSGLLRSCYTRALAVADELGARSLALPAVSAGVYGWPARDAADLALDAVLTTTTAVTEARFVLFDRRMLDVFTEALVARRR